MFKDVSSHVMYAFQGPAFQKMVQKVTSRKFIVPIVYAGVSVLLFALVYSLIGYNKLFETNETNKDKNIENSVVASLMLQANAGNVAPLNSLGNWLMSAQFTLGWLYFLLIVSAFVGP
jgi:hypothetical protein